MLYIRSVCLSNETMQKRKPIGTSLLKYNTKREDLSIDSFITGFPQFSVAKIRDNLELLKTTYIDELREGGCITALKESAISFSLDGLVGSTYLEESFVSELLLKAGLNLMPNLRSTFYYDFADQKAGVMEKLLRPVIDLIDCHPLDY